MVITISLQCRGIGHTRARVDPSPAPLRETVLLQARARNPESGARAGRQERDSSRGNHAREWQAKNPLRLAPSL
jgi:hypothetical protein